MPQISQPIAPSL